MKRLKGPELKMPDLKVPPFFQDLYWDLRDRRLLPLIALIVVAIAAVPFLLGGGSSPELQPDSAGSPSAEAESARASDLVVVQATPGLRDYRRRLAGRTAKDPFSQPAQPRKALKGAQIEFSSGSGPATASATGADSSGAESGPTGSEPAPSGGDSGSAGASPPDSSPSGASKPPSQDGGDGNRGGSGGDETLSDFAIDVRITKSGGDAGSGKQEPVVKKKVLALTPLPGEKAPVVTYMGRSEKGKALLMVSNDVKAVFGETKCISGDDVCQLLEAERGFPVTFVYGNGETHYTFKVLKIYSVATGNS
jgi:hypothetical protein